ncbi:hypothetical protein AB0L70_04455 [Kribbella sp. NPDC051952]|uniref:hypothetical protein n=1 Tax=Kribbella sp. NPDC051952 TaxID=3154851 RepID=UPI0034289798
MIIESADEFVRVRFSDDPEEYGRAARGSASLEVWLDVIERYPDARFWVAHNKTVPLEILERLVADPDWRVRSMVASKRKATPEILARLADDEHDSVRLTVAYHRNTSEQTLLQMVDDPWEDIRAKVDERLNPPDQGE